MLADNHEWLAELAGHRVRVRCVERLTEVVGRVNGSLADDVLVVIVNGDVGEEIGGDIIAVLPFVYVEGADSCSIGGWGLGGGIGGGDGGGDGGGGVTVGNRDANRGVDWGWCRGR